MNAVVDILKFRVHTLWENFWAWEMPIAPKKESKGKGASSEGSGGAV